MFDLTSEGYNSLKSQISTLEKVNIVNMELLRLLSVSMLSSLLNSRRAIKVNIQIIRIFTRILQMLTDDT